MWIKLLATIAILSTFNAIAFDWSKCEKQASRLHTLGPLLSTTSYFSSTGRCSMVGQASHDKKVFIAKNSYEMMIDPAKGGGEWLYSYASLSGCSPKRTKQFSKSVQKYFETIYSSEEPKEIYRKIEPIVKMVCGATS